MGDIAEAMLDGTFDYMTGEYLGDGPGYPRTASQIKPPRSVGGRRHPKVWFCPTCRKKMRGLYSVRQHMKAVHGTSMEQTATLTYEDIK